METEKTYLNSRLTQEKLWNDYVGNSVASVAGSLYGVQSSKDPEWLEMFQQSIAGLRTYRKYLKDLFRRNNIPKEERKMQINEVVTANSNLQRQLRRIFLQIKSTATGLSQQPLPREIEIELRNLMQKCMFKMHY